MSRTEDFERLRTFVREHAPGGCTLASGHCSCLLCLLDEIASDTVLTSDEAAAIYHLLVQRGVSSVAEPTLYALRHRISTQVRLQEGAKPQPFAWRVP